MNEAFERARADAVYAVREYAGFGTYGEKSVHAVLKRYIEPDADFHEVGIEGSIADICRDNKIYEIQTRSLYKLKPKLEKFLPHYKVCIVYPIIAEKTIYTLDPQTHTVTRKRKSPLKRGIYDFLPQIYPLRDFLENENLSFKIMLLTASEYRIADSSKDNRKSEKFDMIPNELLCEMNLSGTADFIKFIPPLLPDEFGSVDYAAAAHIKRHDAQIALNILARCGIIEKIHKKQRAFFYRIIE